MISPFDKLNKGLYVLNFHLNSVLLLFQFKITYTCTVGSMSIQLTTLGISYLHIYDSSIQQVSLLVLTKPRRQDLCTVLVSSDSLRGKLCSIYDKGTSHDRYRRCIHDRVPPVVPEKIYHRSLFYSSCLRQYCLISKYFFYILFFCLLFVWIFFLLIISNLIIAQIVHFPKRCRKYY